MENKINIFNFTLDATKGFLNNETDLSQSQLNQNAQLLTLQDLEAKASVLLSRTHNDPETEQDFRRTCELFKNQNPASSSQLNKAYQKYVDAYHKITSLYILYWKYHKSFLNVFDTEEERSKCFELNLPEELNFLACTTLLPNGELFCFGDLEVPGIALIVDSDYKIKVLVSGVPCLLSSAIYFDRNVYCFGGMNKIHNSLNLATRFNLDENRWIKLAHMPKDDHICDSVVFNRQILISGYRCRNLLLYSIDIDSFSTISFDFVENTRKLLVNAGRLYLIECKPNGLIFENEADVYSWKQIAKSSNSFLYRAFCSYNKGEIYITADSLRRIYYNFKIDIGSKHGIKQ